MFRIGEFSIIAQVSGRLLRYYDELGLLSPEYTDPQTGYRYYSAGQLPRLNRILVLKELDLSLEQIAKLVDQHASADEIQGMLTLRKAQIEQSVQEEMARLRMVEARLEQIDAHGHIQEPDVVLKSIPVQPFLALREVLPSLEVVRRLAERIYAVVPASVGQSSLGQVAIVIHSAMYDPDALDFEIGYVLTGKAPKTVRLSEDRTLTVCELPAFDTVATLAHVGRLSDVHQTYGALAVWLEQNQWEIIGAGRQILMQVPQPGKDEGAVVELQFPVRKANAKFVKS